MLIPSTQHIALWQNADSQSCSLLVIAQHPQLHSTVFTGTAKKVALFCRSCDVRQKFSSCQAWTVACCVRVLTSHSWNRVGTSRLPWCLNSLVWWTWQQSPSPKCIVSGTGCSMVRAAGWAGQCTASVFDLTCSTRHPLRELIFWLCSQTSDRNRVCGLALFSPSLSQL